jgi:hypothetical protein
VLLQLTCIAHLVLPSLAIFISKTNQMSSRESDDANDCPIPYAVWPDHAPHAEEDCIIMVIAFESQYRWAVFRRHENEFHPTVYWR